MLMFISNVLTIFGLSVLLFVAVLMIVRALVWIVDNLLGD